MKPLYRVAMFIIVAAIGAAIFWHDHASAATNTIPFGVYVNVTAK